MEKGYLFSYFYWTQATGSQKIGKCGVAALSKVKPLGHLFGFEDRDLGEEARLISFPDLVVVGTYSPKGILPESLAAKIQWEND